MSGIKVGDIVGRKSYGCDVLFKVAEIRRSENGNNICVLKGLTQRLIADAPAEDLEIMKVAEKTAESGNKKRNKV